MLCLAGLLQALAGRPAPSCVPGEPGLVLLQPPLGLWTPLQPFPMHARSALSPGAPGEAAFRVWGAGCPRLHAQGTTLVGPSGTRGEAGWVLSSVTGERRMRPRPVPGPGSALRGRTARFHPSCGTSWWKGLCPGPRHALGL